MLVTSFCDLQISEVSAGGQHTFTQFLRKIINIFEFLEMFAIHCLVYGFQDISVRSGSQNCIYFRHFFDDLILIALCHTTCDDQNLTGSLFFIFCHLKDRVDTFLFSIIDEAAGVYHDHLCLGFVIYDFETVPCEKAQHLFRVYQILITA